MVLLIPSTSELMSSFLLIVFLLSVPPPLGKWSTPRRLAMLIPAPNDDVMAGEHPSAVFGIEIFGVEFLDCFIDVCFGEILFEKGLRHEIFLRYVVFKNVLNLCGEWYR